MDISKKIIEKSLGETRFHPDEQKKYLGTYRERVLLALTLEEAYHTDNQVPFKNEVMTFSETYNPLFLKISHQLPTQTQFFYLKIASKCHIHATIVHESNATSPYGLILHTDTAVNKEDITLPKMSSDCHSIKLKKTGFWKSLFQKR